MATCSFRAFRALKVDITTLTDKTRPNDRLFLIDFICDIARLCLVKLVKCMVHILLIVIGLISVLHVFYFFLHL